MMKPSSDPHEFRQDSSTTDEDEAPSTSSGWLGKPKDRSDPQKPDRETQRLYAGGGGAGGSGAASSSSAAVPASSSRTTTPRITMTANAIIQEIEQKSSSLASSLVDTVLQRRNVSEQEQKRKSLRRIWHLFIKLLMPYWKRERSGRWLFLQVLVLAIQTSIVTVVFSYLSRDFWNAISEKDIPTYHTKAWQIFIVICIAVPLTVYYSFRRGVLIMQWRRWMTNTLLKAFMSEQNFYHAETAINMDNPDQRISEDVRQFTSMAVTLFFSVFKSMIDLVSFSIILFSIYPLLFVGLLVYASIGTVISWFVGRKLIHLSFVQLQREADFRFNMVRVRENAESIAFYRGEQRELNALEYLLWFALENYYDLLKWTRNLDFWTTFYTYNVSLVPVLIVTPLYFNGKLGLGALNQAWSAFDHVLTDLSVVINEFENLSTFSANIDRLGDMVEFLEGRMSSKDKRVFIQDVNPETVAAEYMVDPDQPKIELNYILVHLTKVQVPLDIKSMSLVTPDLSHRLLIKELNLTLNHGDRLLIVGPSGSGKSSLLRAMAGLWRNGSGSIQVLSHERTMFLPQKPFCTIGSLRDQILYPESVSSYQDTLASLDLIQDANLAHLLTRVGLAGLEKKFESGFDAVKDWGEVLSVGEQQRLAFSRVLLSYESGRTQFVICDESSSALDVDSENLVYSLLEQTDMAYVSVGHRLTLARFHTKLLRLSNDGQGGWTVSIITEEVRRNAAIAAQFRL